MPTATVRLHGPDGFVLTAAVDESNPDCDDVEAAAPGKPRMSDLVQEDGAEVASDHLQGNRGIPEGNEEQPGADGPR